MARAMKSADKVQKFIIN